LILGLLCTEQNSPGHQIAANIFRVEIFAQYSPTKFLPVSNEVFNQSGD
jgi:hypothetical protein